VDAGEATLSVSAERYLPYETVIDVTGRAQTQRFSASLTPGWASVLVQTAPADVSVQIDQLRVDEPSVTLNGMVLEVMQGSREITFSAPGYIDEVIELDAVADTDVDLGIIELTPAEGMLRLTSVPAGRRSDARRSVCWCHTHTSCDGAIYTPSHSGKPSRLFNRIL
jgi:hypothetical protein